MRYRLAVVALDDLLCEHGDAAVRDIFEIERGLLILHEAAIERAPGALMSGIGRRDGETANQCRLIARDLRSGGFSNGAVLFFRFRHEVEDAVDDCGLRASGLQARG